MGLASSLLSSALTALSHRSEGTGALRSAVGSVMRFPIKAIAVFIAAPYLVLKVAMLARNPWRRTIAVIGLFLSVGLAWLAGTSLGSVVGAIFIASQVSILIGIGFLLGTTLSVVLSVAFCLLVFNATSWLFLQMSAEDVVECLKAKSSE